MTQSFAIIPGVIRAPWVILLLVLPIIALAGGGVVVGASLWGARHATFEVSSAGLRLRGDLYGRLIPVASLELERARGVNLAAERDLRPSRRRFGTALPGYRSGWFTLENGQRALLYVTDVSHVLYVPTRDNYVILLSVRDPAAVLESLRRAAGASPAQGTSPHV